MFSWVDILVLVIIAIYTIDGYRRGFLKTALDVVGIVLSFLIALKFYDIISSILVTQGTNTDLAKPLGFFLLWTITQIVFYFLAMLIFHYIPDYINGRKTNLYFGILAGMIKGTAIVSVFLMIVMIFPVSNNIKSQFSDSVIGGPLIKITADVENRMENILGRLNNTLTFYGVSPEHDGITKLSFQTNQISIDEASENQMLILINNERTKAGLAPLKMDILIRNVARTHSMDMLRNGYFSHDDFIFNGGGENLALAPTMNLAQIGLMNSESHRENILDPQFTRIGIGVIDAGKYGKMITQNFAD
ncbi:MAG: hypothetical protein UT15_C0015G0006 [Berkelbacteria bacterium GW2011_GWA1_39_10]|uniref:SCP domain-containing protein n=1 Tax=Berkelbacteria bacterium GW2011_GWA1_39_10 TaxID=1618332 RepID=A0A0G0LEM7_9BACT|nr:MAG: hypothetical protein UT15_C0015G0006 [Berkelbacteria bacterium GW2011_GWA1_39_10]